MKRWLKVLLICGGLGLFLVILCMGVLLIPAVQKPMVRAIVATYVDDVVIENLSIGPGGVSIQGAHFKQGSVVAGIEDAELDVRWTDTMSTGRLVVETLNVTGLRLETLPTSLNESNDLEAAESQDAGPPDMTQLLGSLGLAQWMSVGSGSLEMLLKTEQGSLDLSLRVRDWEPGSRGQINADWHYEKNEYNQGMLDSLAGELEGFVELDGEGVFTAGEVSGTFQGKGVDDLPLSGEYGLDLTSVTVDGAVQVTLATHTSLSGRTYELFQGKAFLPTEQPRIRFEGESKFDSGDLKPLLAALGQELSPVVVSSRLEGVYDFLTGGLTVDVEGDLDSPDLASGYRISVNGAMLDDMGMRITGTARNRLKSTDERLDVDRMDLLWNARQGIAGGARVRVSDGDKMSQAVNLNVSVPADVAFPVRMEARADKIYYASLGKAIGGFVSALPQQNTIEPEAAEQVPVDGPWFPRDLEVVLEVNRLNINNVFGLDNVGARVVASGSQVRLEDGRFQFLDSNVTQAATLTRVDDRFVLDGEAALRGLSARSVLSQLGGAQLVDADFGGTFKFSSEASDLSLLSESLNINWDLLAKDGQIAVPAQGMFNSIRSGTRLVAGLSFLPGQSYLGNFERIVRRLEEVGFETFSFKGKRAANGLFKIDQAELKGHDFYAELKGQVNSSNWTDLMSSAMRMGLTLGAKGEVADWAKNIGMSEGRMRGDYALWSKLPFSIRGTLENPNFDAVRSWALKLVKGKATQFLEQSDSDARSSDGTAPDNADPANPVLDLLRGVDALKGVLGR